MTGGGTYDLRLFVVQGTDLTATVPGGSVTGGTPVTFSMAFSKTMLPDNTYEGLLQLGPPEAPSAVSVPVIIHRDWPNKTYLPLIFK